MNWMVRSAAVLVALVAAGLGIAYSGVVDASARERHWPVIERLIEWARNRSIAVHAKDISVPTSFDAHDRVVEGMTHYREHCAVCHGGPGVGPDDMAQGMYPAPPDLQQAAARRTPAELFWIIKNGIKMSGMPAWADHGDEELWPIVALVSQLPILNPEDYASLAAEADLTKGGRHAQTRTALPADGPAGTETHDHLGHHHHHDH